jgi:fatty-acyl-CoA synthase
MSLMATTPDPTLSHTVGDTEPPLLEQTSPDNLDATIARFGDREALVDVGQGIRWTYAEFGAQVDRVARACLAAGLAKGDRAGIWAPNLAEWTVVQYATAKVGVVLVNINPAYRTHELHYVLQQAGISFLFGVERFRTSEYASMVEEVRGDCPDLRDVVYFGTDGWDAFLERGDREATDEQVREVQAGLSPDDAINIQYTSGTTGFP